MPTPNTHPPPSYYIIQDGREAQEAGREGSVQIPQRIWNGHDSHPPPRRSKPCQNQASTFWILPEAASRAHCLRIEVGQQVGSKYCPPLEPSPGTAWGAASPALHSKGQVHFIVIHTWGLLPVPWSAGLPGHPRRKATFWGVPPTSAFWMKAPQRLQRDMSFSGRSSSESQKCLKRVKETLYNLCWNSLRENQFGKPQACLLCFIPFEYFIHVTLLSFSRRLSPWKPLLFPTSLFQSISVSPFYISPFL